MVVPIALQLFSLSIVMFDLDDFKSCNDRFGHAAGDDALDTAGPWSLTPAPE